MSRFQYLAKSGCYSVEEIDDAKEFGDVLNAMKVINISEADQEQIFRILAAILHLGNINFVETQTYHAALQDDKCKCFRLFFLHGDLRIFLLKFLNIQVICLV